eukprot:5622178-Amphidinium_carterae.1
MPLQNETLSSPFAHETGEFQPSHEQSNYLTSSKGFGALRLPGSEAVRNALPNAEMEEEVRARIRQASEKWNWVTPKDLPAFYAQRKAVECT